VRPNHGKSHQEEYFFHMHWYARDARQIKTRLNPGFHSPAGQTMAEPCSSLAFSELIFKVRGHE